MNIDLGGIPPASQNQTINTVQWVIVTVPDRTPVAAGLINTSQPGSSASFERFGLVPGVYGVQLTAASEEDGRAGPQTSCIGEGGPFQVNPDEQTVGKILLNCTSERDLGSLRINGEFNRCAIVRTATVSPLQVSVGFDIDVSATAQDDEGDAVDYLWSDGAGTFADPTAATTTYTCLEQGVHDITVSVSDDAAQGMFNNFPPTPALPFTYCSDSWTTTVECVAAPNCGNGVIDPPEEECDPPDVPANWTCDPATCLRIPTCGDGIVDTAEGEQCDNVTPDAFCDASCKDIDPCSPNTCDDSNGCTQNLCSADGNNQQVCDYSQTEVDGTLCDDLEPTSAGACVSGVCQPIPDPIEQIVGNVCVNSLIATSLSYLPYTLSVAPLGPVVDGNPVDVSFTGIALIPASTQNTGINTIPGLTQVNVSGISATVAVRNGATGTPPTLTTQEAVPFLADIVLNNNAAECLAAYPSEGGRTPCVTEPIVLPLNSATATLTPTGGAGGKILVGWDETLDPNTFPLTPPIGGTDPLGPTGIRIDIAGLIFVAFDCTMGECDNFSQTPGPPDCGTGDDSGDSATRLLDAQLISVPIAP
jgi:hypothetical protein